MSFKRNQKVRFITPRGEHMEGVIKDQYTLGDKIMYSICADIPSKLNTFGIESQFITPITGTSRRESSLLKYKARLADLEEKRATMDPKVYNRERANTIKMIALREQQIAEANEYPARENKAFQAELAALHTDADLTNEEAAAKGLIEPLV